MKKYVLVLFKPDVMSKGLMGHLITRFCQSGLELAAIKTVAVTKELAQAHYYHLREKPFFKEIVDYLQGNLHKKEKIVALVYSGNDAIRVCRRIAGATNPEEANPKSIRGSLGRITTKGVYENVVHVSSNSSEAKREIKLWFTPQELGANIFPTKTVTKDSFSVKVWA